MRRSAWSAKRVKGRCLPQARRLGLVGGDLVFDLAEGGAGDHALRYKLVNGRIRTARDDGLCKASAQAVQLLNGGRVDVDALRVNRLRNATIQAPGILRIR